MPTGKDLIELAETRIGEDYYLGVLVPKDDPNWHGPWDCAEFGSWLVYQETKKLYGCYGTQPTIADAYTGKWLQDAQSLGVNVSVQQASMTPGAFVLRAGAKIGHLVLSDGKGGTIEAYSSQRGVIQHTLNGRRWSTGILVPWIEYDVSNSNTISPPGVIYRLVVPYMQDLKVAEIQAALYDLGYEVGSIDGVFGPKTHNAVTRFQEVRGLVVDGEVGPQTANALRVVL